jgi:16S rRNA (guanine966-N2)-methyltransferase
MRVIAGTFRRRKLRSARGFDIRPTSDRLRETMFDVLTAGNPYALEGSVWLDLFAGTGAVGIEALSRGAAMVYFVDRSRTAVALIRNNLQDLQIHEGLRIFQEDAARAIAALEQLGVRADFVFLDPPYAMRTAYSETLQALADSKVARSAVVIVEHEKRFDPGEEFALLRRSRKLEQGDAVLGFYSAQLDTFRIVAPRS